jgi:spermidine synthase
MHGSIIHGYQFHDESLRNLPTSYYGKASGAGLAILNHPNRDKGMRVGVLGLGIGTLAVYGQPGDVYRFYEINPAVIRLAEGQNGYFTYLSDSQAKVEIIPGDARLSLEQELAAGQPQNYDVLLLDVFSSDSIPVHLLDEEAFSVYLQQLSPEGILAVHITNRHLDLVPVVWKLADHFGLRRALINDSGNGVITYQSTWFLLARDPALLATPAIQARAEPMGDYVTPVHMWTDDYNNLFEILK